MQLFIIQSEGVEDALVIAADSDHAARIFVTFHVAEHNCMPAEFSTEAVTRNQLPDADAALWLLVDGDASGIIEWSQEGWVLDPI